MFYSIESGSAFIVSVGCTDWRRRPITWRSSVREQGMFLGMFESKAMACYDPLLKVRHRLDEVCISASRKLSLSLAA
jgi:hypothetical protein